MRTLSKQNHQAYHTREFAALAGVTVRTLRYYDRIGLLKAARSPGGYRLYTARDLEALREILALKAIGFPLSTIAAFRRGAPADVAGAIRAQRAALEQRARLLAKAIRALTEFERTLQGCSNSRAALRQRIKEIIDVEHDNDDWQAAYDTLRHAWQARLPHFPREALIEFGQEWEALS